MSQEIKATAVYFGKRDAMIAEAGARDFEDGKFLVKIVGNAEWDSEGFDTIKEAREHAKATAETFGVKAVRIN